MWKICKIFVQVNLKTSSLFPFPVLAAKYLDGYWLFRGWLPTQVDYIRRIGPLCFFALEDHLHHLEVVLSPCAFDSMAGMGRKFHVLVNMISSLSFLG